MRRITGTINMYLFRREWLMGLGILRGIELTLKVVDGEMQWQNSLTSGLIWILPVFMLLKRMTKRLVTQLTIATIASGNVQNNSHPGNPKYEIHSQPLLKQLRNTSGGAGNTPFYTT